MDSCIDLFVVAMLPTHYVASPPYLETGRIRIFIFGYSKSNLKIVQAVNINASTVPQ